MEKYKYCNLQDLVWDDVFRQWVLSPTPETNAVWHQWLSENPERWDIVQDASQIVRSVKVAEPTISDQEIRRLVQKTLQKVEKIEELPQNTEGVLNVELGMSNVGLHNRQNPIADTRNTEGGAELDIDPLKVVFYRQTWFRIAASVALLIGLGWWSLGVQKAKQSEETYENLIAHAPSTLIETTNNANAPQIVQLSDGSKVTLKKGSRISYESTFMGDKRVVYLSGEAFFEVAKNPNKPFLVYANELVTTVLGTSFTIKAYQKDKEVTVEVKTGRVSVSTKKGEEGKTITKNNVLTGLVLTPNQKIVFNREVEQLTKTLVDVPEIVVPKNEKQTFNFDFEDTPASEVFRVLEAAYNIHIEYNEAVLKNCPVTAPLTDQPLFDKLKIICKAIEAHYEILDGQIIIESRGCK
jgi:transmembrane sensor